MTVSGRDVWKINEFEFVFAPSYRDLSRGKMRENENYVGQTVKCCKQIWKLRVLSTIFTWVTLVFTTSPVRCGEKAQNKSLQRVKGTETYSYFILT